MGAGVVPASVDAQTITPLWACSHGEAMEEHMTRVCVPKPWGTLLRYVDKRRPQTRWCAILSFGPAPRRCLFRSPERAVEAAHAWKSSRAGCGSTLRVVEFACLRDAQRYQIGDYPNARGWRVLASL